MVDSPPPPNTFDYSMSVLKHLTLPCLALILSSFFLSVYNYRTFFLIYSSEDYVDMAKAKGLPARDIERTYILRPTLPTIITNFSLLIITLWTGALFTETVFLWPGLGAHAFSGDRPIRYAHNCRLIHHLRLYACHDRFPARFCIRPC